MARRSKVILSSEDWAALTARQQDAYRRALRAGNRLQREKISASRAVKAERTTLDQLRRAYGTDLRRVRGRLTITRDRAYRRMWVVTTSGTRSLEVTKEEAQVVSGNMNAIAHYGVTQDRSWLAQYRATYVGGYKLVSDDDDSIALINELSQRGELDFEDIYDM